VTGLPRKRIDCGRAAHIADLTDVFQRVSVLSSRDRQALDPAPGRVNSSDDMDQRRSSQIRKHLRFSALSLASRRIGFRRRCSGRPDLECVLNASSSVEVFDIWDDDAQHSVNTQQDFDSISGLDGNRRGFKGGIIDDGPRYSSWGWQATLRPPRDRDIPLRCQWPSGSTRWWPD
jgi:hypothetical protein